MNALSRLATLTLLAAVAAANPQGGYTAEDHPDLGIALQRPRDYEQVPTQPDEEFVVLYYTCKDKGEFTRTPPSLSVVWIDWHADPAPAKPEGAPPVPDGATATKPAEKEGGSKSEPPPPITTLERYFEQKTAWKFTEGQPGKEREGYQSTVHALELQKKYRDATQLQQQAGWCYAYRQDQKRAIAFFGECDKEDLEAHAKIWRYIAEHAKFTEPTELSTDAIRAKYATTKMRGIDYRVKVRSKLVRGWKAEDTSNFIVVYHTKDQPLLRRLLGDLEAVREKYVELFPPVAEVTAVSTVRVCKDRQEYLAYGGWPGTAGFWNSETEELVFFDAAADNKRERAEGREDTLSVLYHEAFHQYIHYSAGELPPHSWFNEGHGDYFAGAHITSGKVRKIGVFDWRIHTIQAALARHIQIPWREIIRFEQPDYYRPDRVGLCYAEGWSMIYFLRTSPKVRKNPQWSKILDTYFVELKAEYGRQLDALKTAGKSEDKAAREEAGKKAREHAVDRAFQGVNIDELQSEWETFTSQIDFKD